MVHVKKCRAYQLFPLFSMASLASIWFIGRHQADLRDATLVDVYAYLIFNALFPLLYMFLVAYLVPLFLSLHIGRRVARVLYVTAAILALAYIVASLYFFFAQPRRDLFPQSVDIGLGIVLGLVLGVASSGSKQESE